MGVETTHVLHQQTFEQFIGASQLALS